MGETESRLGNLLLSLSLSFFNFLHVLGGILFEILEAALAAMQAEHQQTLRLALEGQPAAQVHLPTEVNPLEIVLRLPRPERES